MTGWQNPDPGTYHALMKGRIQAWRKGRVVWRRGVEETIVIIGETVEFEMPSAAVKAAVVDRRVTEVRTYPESWVSPDNGRLYGPRTAFGPRTAIRLLYIVPKMGPSERAALRARVERGKPIDEEWTHRAYVDGFVNPIRADPDRAAHWIALSARGGRLASGLER